MGHDDVRGARSRRGQLGNPDVPVADDFRWIGNFGPPGSVAVVEVHLGRDQLAFLLRHRIRSKIQVRDQHVHVTVVVEVEKDRLTTSAKAVFQPANVDMSQLAIVVAEQTISVVATVELKEVLVAVAVDIGKRNAVAIGTRDVGCPGLDR